MCARPPAAKPHHGRREPHRPQPQQHLVAEGLSNKEIGERLYLSPRTVGSHLYRIFPKLNITARAQMAARLVSV
jgi:DNA-binding NarL/FixJ family response regulator